MISSFGEICPITLLENIQRSYAMLNNLRLVLEKISLKATYHN